MENKWKKAAAAFIAGLVLAGCGGSGSIVPTRSVNEPTTSPAQDQGADTTGSPSRAPSPRTIQFSGYEWRVKSSTGKVGPGPNYFSDSTSNVSVDSRGRLHLRITRVKGRWYCAEVVSKRSFGFGTYRFYLDTPVDILDPNVVLGLFTWNDDPAYSHREIDIEFARWGNTNDMNNAQYVVQPYYLAGHMLRFPVPPGLTATTHAFTWQSNRVFFQSVRGHYPTPPETSAIIREWTYSGQDIPQAGGENARINLWLMNGAAPRNKSEVEIIVRRFEFAN